MVLSDDTLKLKIPVQQTYILIFRLIRIDYRRNYGYLKRGYILDLITTYYLLDAALLSLSLAGKIDNLPDPPPNTLPEIADEDIKTHYQQLVSLILYLSLCTQPDLAFTAMSLGQHNSNSSQKNLLNCKMGFTIPFWNT